ncbi:ABC transporter permease [Rhodococcus jostii]|uniref:Peptide/nickel transport system permease protein n=1 Tax=Rhodococcus jostii TaxID=132919 RepID=A0A1H4JAH8_RHOJO|nr:ABC transporter permease [Rhodococcus jostii]SEB42582.1 peptide/nickel transport system permease protein [Rhodococcus jostii]
MSTTLAPVVVTTHTKPARKLHPGYWAAITFLAVVVLVALAAPWVAPYPPDVIDFDAIWEGPSAAHLLGTDQLGRDLLSRIIFGSRASLLGPLVLLIIATALGVAIGTVAAWKGGWVDTLLARITDVMFAFPGLLFVVLMIAVFGKGPFTAVIALGLAFAPVIAKFTRSIALSELSRPYIDVYRVQGVGAVTVCVRYVIPNLAPALLGYLVVLFGEGLMGLATLSYLGFGSQPPSSEWGLMVQEGQDGILLGFFWPTAVPGIAIAAVVVAVNIIGVRIADRLDSRR